jgi:N-acetylglucosamine kinase-like BadF-type ATPase
LQEPQYVIGIEATGRTVALLANTEGEIIGEGVAGPAVYSVVGQERSGRALWTAILSAFSSAGINTRDLLQAGQTLPDVAAICVGMTGVERPKDEGQVRRILTEFNLFKQIMVTSEAAIVLETGSVEGYGVAVLAGDTGLAFAKGPQGQTARAGGWGYLLGDEGSAHYNGLQAVKAVLKAADGRGAATGLTKLVEREWKLPEGRADTLSQRVYSLLAGLGTGGNKAQIEDAVEGYKRALANLAPLVERAAAGGDSVAGAILDETAEALALAAQAVMSRTGLGSPAAATPLKFGGLNFELKNPAGPAPKVPLTIYGSVLLSNYGELRRRLQARLPQCDDPIAVLNPAEGAVSLALELATKTDEPS